MFVVSYLAANDCGFLLLCYHHCVDTLRPTLSLLCQINFEQIKLFCERKVIKRVNQNLNTKRVCFSLSFQKCPKCTLNKFAKNNQEDQLKCQLTCEKYSKKCGNFCAILLFLVKLFLVDKDLKFHGIIEKSSLLSQRTNTPGNLNLLIVQI